MVECLIIIKAIASYIFSNNIPHIYFSEVFPIIGGEVLFPLHIFMYFADSTKSISET